MGRVFDNGPVDRGSISGRVIPKTQIVVHDFSLLNTQLYKLEIKGKVGSSRERSTLSPTPWSSSYWKGSLRVALDYCHQLYFIYAHTHTHTHMYICNYVLISELDQTTPPGFQTWSFTIRSSFVLDPEYSSFVWGVLIPCKKYGRRSLTPADRAAWS